MSPSSPRRLAKCGLLALTALFAVVAATDGAEAKKRCRSEAYEKEDAIEYCAGVLDCDEEDVSCRGTARRWICTCESESSQSEGPQFRFQFDFGLGGDHDDRDDSDGGLRWHTR